MAKSRFYRYNTGTFMVRADEQGEGEAAASPDVATMVADAVRDLRGFCDSMRADFGALNARMDSMEAARPAARADAETTEADVSGVAVEHGENGGGAAKPASEHVDPAAAVETDRVAATEDAAIEAAKPHQMAADAGVDMDALADSAAQRVAAPLRADLDRLSRLIPAELTAEQRQQFAAAQEQASAAFQAFGDHAPAPMQGEGLDTYKRRMAAKLQGHSDKWKGTKLTAIGDSATLDIVITDIYNDAVAVARRGADVAPGRLAPVTRRTPAGHTIVEYRGSPGAWMRPLAGATRRATGKFNTGR